MSIHSLEVRMKTLERRQYHLEIYVEELSQKVTASFQQQPDYQPQPEDQLKACRDQIKARLERMEERSSQAIPTTWEKTFAESRIESEGEYFAKVETRFDQMETLLTQILERLPDK